MCTWFKHDSLARQDRKLRKLLAEYGWAGYGVFFGILELMAYDSDHRLEYDLQLLAHSLGLTKKKEREMLRAIVEDYGLFVIDTEANEFYSPRMMTSLAEIDEAKAQRMAEREERERGARAKRQASAKQREHLERARQNRDVNRASNRERNRTQIENKIETQIENRDRANRADAPEIESPIEEQIENNSSILRGTIGGEEREETKEIEKDRERGGKALGRFSPPTLQEVQDYCQSKGYAWDAEAFWLYYESNGWMVGRNKMKNWRSACANWNKREDSTYRNWQQQRSAPAGPPRLEPGYIPVDPNKIDLSKW